MPENNVIVCTQNVASQMAEAFFYYTKDLTVYSAGIKPGTKINSITVQVIKEIRIDMTSKKPKIISVDLIDDSKVNMCMDKKSHPVLFVDCMVHWNIPVPKEKSTDKVRQILNYIESQVQTL